MQQEKQYPNNLKETRMRTMITRAQLSLRCKELAEHEPTSFVPFSADSIKGLERGDRRPRRNTAFTLAKALGTTPEELFPVGFDDQPRNPLGKTHTAESPRRGGRPKKS